MRVPVLEAGTRSRTPSQAKHWSLLETPTDFRVRRTMMFAVYPRRHAQ
jgi:hypothetical protein